MTFGAPKRVTLARNPSRASINLPGAGENAKMGSAEQLRAKVKANLQTGASGKKDGISALLQADPQDRMLPRPVSLCTITKHPHHNSSHRAHVHAKSNTCASNGEKKKKVKDSLEFHSYPGLHLQNNKNRSCLHKTMQSSSAQLRKTG